MSDGRIEQDDAGDDSPPPETTISTVSEAGDDAQGHSENNEDSAPQANQERRLSPDTVDLRTQAAAYALGTDDLDQSTRQRNSTEEKKEVISKESGDEEKIKAQTDFTENAGAEAKKSGEILGKDVADHGNSSEPNEPSIDSGETRLIEATKGVAVVSANDISSASDGDRPKDMLNEEATEFPDASASPPLSLVAPAPPPLRRSRVQSLPGAFNVRSSSTARAGPTDRSTTSNHGDGSSEHLVSAQLVEEDVERQDIPATAESSVRLVEAEPLEEPPLDQLLGRLLRNRKVQIVVAVILLAFVGLVVGTVVGITNSGNGGEIDEGDDEDEEDDDNEVPSLPTAAPTLETDVPLEALFNSRVSPQSREALQNDVSSPQAKAYQWLRDSPLLSTYSTARRLQRYTLATFYYATGGPNWLASDGWLSNQNECDWFSSSNETICDGEQYRVLQLISNDLQGTVPDDLHLLSSLQVFIIEDNGGVIGNIPTWLGALTELSSLLLVENSLSGFLPSEISELTMLEDLDLQGNFLVGAIPSQLGKLSSLKNLLLGVNELSGPLPSELGQLTMLDLIAVYFTRISGTIPTELALLTSLTVLDLDVNELSGQLPSELGRLRNVTEVLLSENLLSSTIPTEFGLMSSLQLLYLQINNLYGAIPSSLGLCTGLQVLNVSSNMLTGTMPDEICALNKPFQLASLVVDCEMIACDCCTGCPANAT